LDGCGATGKRQVQLWSEAGVIAVVH